MSSKIDLMDEGLLNVLHAGGCQCDPPGSGEEFCTGHCVLRAEVERLKQILARSDSDEEARLRAEVERLRAFVQRVALYSNDAWLAREADELAPGASL